ncbi:MAG: glycosyltransferase, partial [Nitrososphaerota archaeon]|nr:glycosyltransferase [Nitrososphaerota archaeon]
MVKLLITQSNLTLKGGAERIVLEIAQHYGAKIYTAEYDRKGTFEEFDGMDIQVIGKPMLARFLPYGRAMQGLNYGFSFYNLRIKEDYDVINAHMAPSHWVRNLNPRVLWYCHTPIREVYDLYKYRMSLRKGYQKPLYIAGAKVVRKIDRKVSQNIEFVFANSMNTRKRITKYLGLGGVEVLGGGVNYERYHNDGDGKYFFYPSRISPNKRQDYVIRAFSNFRRMKKGYKLIVAGAVSKDQSHQLYYMKVLELAKRVKDVEVLGNIGDDRLLDLYSRATAVLYAPIDEDYGLVPLEAMASSKVVIAVNEGGPKHTIKAFKTGFLVNSEEEMAERMLFVAEHPSIAEDMGKSGASVVRRDYSWKRFFERFDEGIKKVM